MKSDLILLVIGMVCLGTSHCGAVKKILKSKSHSKRMGQSTVHGSNKQENSKLIFDTKGDRSCGPDLASHFITKEHLTYKVQNGTTFTSGTLEVTQDITDGSRVIVYYYKCNDDMFKTCDQDKSDFQGFYEDDLCKQLGPDGVTDEQLDPLEGFFEATEGLPETCPISVGSYEDKNEEMYNKKFEELYKETSHEYWVGVLKWQNKDGDDIYCQELPVHIHPAEN